MKFTIQRFHGSQLVTEMADLDHETTKGIVLMIWGVVPSSLESGGRDDEEWKLHVGGEHWIIVARTS